MEIEWSQTLVWRLSVQVLSRQNLKQICNFLLKSIVV